MRREHLSDAFQKHLVVVGNGMRDQIQLSTDVEHGGTFGSGTAGSRVEDGLVSGGELAGALGDVQDDTQRGPLELIGPIATSSGQTLDDVGGRQAFFVRAIAGGPITACLSMNQSGSRVAWLLVVTECRVMS